MQSLRDETDSESAKKCRELTEKYQTAARNLGEKSETLPNHYSTYLGLASIRLKTCVSCDTAAPENCQKVDEDILEMNERMNSEIKK